MPKVTIDLPKEVFSAHDAFPKEFVRDLRLAAAIYWYQKSEISQEKAATIAGLNRRDFIEALAREQVDVFVVDFDDLRFLQPNNAAQFQPHDRFWSNCAPLVCICLIA